MGYVPRGHNDQLDESSGAPRLLMPCAKALSSAIRLKPARPLRLADIMQRSHARTP